VTRWVMVLRAGIVHPRFGLDGGQCLPNWVNGNGLYGWESSCRLLVGVTRNLCGSPASDFTIFDREDGVGGTELSKTIKRLCLADVKSICTHSFERNANGRH